MIVTCQPASQIVGRIHMRQGACFKSRKFAFPVHQTSFHVPIPIDLRFYSRMAIKAHLKTHQSRTDGIKMTQSRSRATTAPVNSVSRTFYFAIRGVLIQHRHVTEIQQYAQFQNDIRLKQNRKCHALRYNCTEIRTAHLKEIMDKQLREAALQYHRQSPAGKISVNPTKPMTTQRDLALAYSPGVAAACEAIMENPAEVHNLTARGNLVAVITNGTAVLGLGAIGPLAAKPVMEGKGVLFKKFAGIDVFDLEIAERDPDRLVDIIA